jgi:hypothetical protein
MESDIEQRAPVVLQGYSVFHVDANESQSALKLACYLTTGFGDITIACRPQQTNSRIASGRHHLRNGTTANLRTIFIKSHVSHPMRPVLIRSLPSFFVII